MDIALAARRFDDVMYCANDRGRHVHQTGARPRKDMIAREDKRLLLSVFDSCSNPGMESLQPLSAVAGGDAVAEWWTSPIRGGTALAISIRKQKR